MDYGQSGIGILICLHPTPFLWSLHITNQRRCVHRSTFKLCGVAFEEGPLVPPQRENPLFCATLVGEIVPLYPPSDADFVFSDIRGGHSVPVSWVGFHRWDFLPSTFCHSVGEMAPHYSPKRDNNNRFLRVFLLSVPGLWAGLRTRVFLPAAIIYHRNLDCFFCQGDSIHVPTCSVFGSANATD